MSIYSACGGGGGSMAQAVNTAPPGSFLVSNGGLTTASSWTSFTLTDHEILLRRIEAIEARLAIIEPNQELQDKYPALQEAYDAYKIIERLVK